MGSPAHSLTVIPRVLVVDDDRDLAESVCATLEEDGFQATFVSSAAKALEQHDDGTSRLNESWWNFKYVPCEARPAASRACSPSMSRSPNRCWREGPSNEARRSTADSSARYAPASPNATGRGGVTFANERFREHTGRDDDALSRSRLQDLIHPDDAVAHVRRLERFFENGVPYDEELRL